MKSHKISSLIAFALLMLIGLQTLSCSHPKEMDRDELLALAMEQADEVLCAPVDVNGLKASEMLPTDIPIFPEGTLTYVNRIPFQNSVNIFHRYNTSELNKEEVIAYYKTVWSQSGWEVNLEKSSDTKLFLKKDKTYVTLRIFDMPLVEDEFKTAFTINLVKPKNI